MALGWRGPLLYHRSMTPLYILGAAMIGLLTFIAWKVSVGRGPAGEDADALRTRVARLETALEQKTGECGELKKAVEHERTEKIEQQGKGKQLFAQLTELKADADHLKKERDALQKLVNKFEEAEARQSKEALEKITKLDAALRSFEDEKARVRREDEAKLKQAEEERDRLWAEHETNVISALNELCKVPEYAFSAFTNTSLPDGFEGSLKPDFMIEFLGQYVIFDAKVSKAESLQTYITDAVKKTAEKVKKNDRIFPTIFLVVPSAALGELKKTYYPKDGFTFFVIGPESLAPVLYCFKRITAYEKMEAMDPQQREAIVNFIADMDVHVSMRNSIDVLLTKQGVDLLEKTAKIDPSLSEEIARKKQEKVKNLPTIMNNVFKKLVASTEEQSEEVEKLVAPRASVHQKDLNLAREAITKKPL